MVHPDGRRAEEMAGAGHREEVAVARRLVAVDVARRLMAVAVAAHRPVVDGRHALDTNLPCFRSDSSCI